MEILLVTNFNKCFSDIGLTKHNICSEFPLENDKKKKLTKCSGVSPLELTICGSQPLFKSSVNTCRYVLVTKTSLRRYDLVTKTSLRRVTS